MRIREIREEVSRGRWVRLLVSRGQEVRRWEDRRFAEDLRRAVKWQERLRDLKKRLDEVKEAVRRAAERVPGYTVIRVETEGAGAKVTFKDRVEIPEEVVPEVVEWLREQGYRPEVLIRERNSYAPTKELVQILKEAGRLDWLRIREHKPTVEFYGAGEEGF